MKIAQLFAFLQVQDYNGIYLLAENVKRDRNRVNIQKHTADSLDGRGCSTQLENERVVS